MKTNEILKFEIDKMELIEELNNSQFAKVKVWCFATGNNLHDKPVKLSALKAAEKTILNKPLTMAYDARRDDASNHSPQQVPFGMVSLDANTSYEISEDGRIFFCVEALIWKYYSGRVLQIFEKADDNEKQVSVEINVLEYEEQEDGKQAISSFVYRCITLIGDVFNSAIPDAKAQILEFAKAKEEYEQQTFSNDNNLEFQNKSKEVEVMADKEKMAKDEEKMAEVEVEIKDENEPESQEGEVECAKVACEKCGEVECACKAEMSADSVDYKVKYEEMETKYSTLESEKADLATKYSELEAKFSTLEAEVSSTKETFATLEQENASLKEFKANVEKTERDNAIEFAISEVAEDIGAAQVDEWRGRVGEFETVEAFANAIKSFAYEATKGKKSKKKDEISRISLSTAGEGSNEPMDCWAKLKNKIN